MQYWSGASLGTDIPMTANCTNRARSPFLSKSVSRGSYGSNSKVLESWNLHVRSAARDLCQSSHTRSHTKLVRAVGLSALPLIVEYIVWIPDLWKTCCCQNLDKKYPAKHWEQRYQNQGFVYSIFQYAKTQTQSVTKLLDKMKREIVPGSEENLEVSSYSCQPCHFLSCASQAAHVTTLRWLQRWNRTQWLPGCIWYTAGLSSSTLELLLMSWSHTSPTVAAYMVQNETLCYTIATAQLSYAPSDGGWNGMSVTVPSMGQGVMSWK